MLLHGSDLIFNDPKYIVVHLITLILTHLKQKLVNKCYRYFGILVSDSICGRQNKLIGMRFKISTNKLLMSHLELFYCGLCITFGLFIKITSVICYTKFQSKILQLLHKRFSHLECHLGKVSI